MEGEAEWLRESEGDFMRLFRFNILILAAVVSIAALSVDVLASFDGVAGVPDAAGTTVFGVALLFWFTSTLIAVMAYGGLDARLGSEPLFRTRGGRRRPESDSGGCGGHPLEDTELAEKVADLNSDRYYECLLAAYVRANERNHVDSSVRYRLYLGSVTLLVLSVILFVSQ